MLRVSELGVSHSPGTYSEKPDFVSISRVVGFNVEGFRCRGYSFAWHIFRKARF